MARKKKVRRQRQISVPSDLDQRMRKHGDINWSQVAREAFEKHVTDLERRKRNPKMNAAIERLRQSKLEVEGEEKVAGHEAGRKWTSEDAEFVAIRRLDEATPREGPDGWRSTRDSDAYSAAECVAMAILGDHADRQEVSDFWEQVCGEQHPDESFVIGFVAGALEAWHLIENQI